MAHHIDASELKYIMPKKEIKPKVYQQNAGQTLFIGALARFDFIQGDRSAFTIHVANDLPIHRTKLEKADALYEEHKGELLAPQLRTLSTSYRHWFVTNFPSKKRKQM